MNPILIAIRVIINPFVNVFQKKLTSQGIPSIHIVFFTYVFCAAVSFPVILVNGVKGFSISFWITILLMSVVGTAGNALLILSLKHTDLSIFGPINSFKPVIGMILAFFLIGEIPSAMGLSGAVVIAAGSAFLSYVPGQGISALSLREMIFSKGVLLRFGSLTLISIEAVLMKKALVSAGALLTFSLWAAAGIPFLIIFILFMKPAPIITSLRLCKNMPYYTTTAITLYGIMQCVTFYVFTHTIVGYSLAIFQLSSIISVFLGHAIFKEKGLIPKLIGSIVMVAGTLLIIV